MSLKPRPSIHPDHTSLQDIKANGETYNPQGLHGLLAEHWDPHAMFTANVSVQMYAVLHPDLMIQPWHVYVAFVLITCGIKPQYDPKRATSDLHSPGHLLLP